MVQYQYLSPTATTYVHAHNYYFIINACCAMQGIWSYNRWTCLLVIFSHRTSRSRHIIPLRRFLEGVFGQDLRSFFAESCFEVYACVYFVMHNEKLVSSYQCF